MDTAPRTELPLPNHHSVWMFWDVYDFVNQLQSPVSIISTVALPPPTKNTPHPRFGHDKQNSWKCFFGFLLVASQVDRPVEVPMRPFWKSEMLSRCCPRSTHSCLNDELVVDVFRTSKFRRGVFKGVNIKRVWCNFLDKACSQWLSVQEVESRLVK